MIILYAGNRAILFRSRASSRCGAVPFSFATSDGYLCGRSSSQARYSDRSRSFL